MNPENDPLDPRLEAVFAALRPVPGRDPQAAAKGRTHYINQIRSLQGERSPALGVSAGGIARLKGWISSIRASFQIKERSPMFSTLMTILISACLLFGGVGVTAYAAQDSLPAEALYPLKVLSEDLRSYLTAQPQSRLSLLLELADQRVLEMIALDQAGDTIPEQTHQRWQAHVEQAFQLAAQSGQIEMNSFQLRSHLRQQEQLLSRLQTRAGDPNEPLIAQVRAMLQERLRLAEEGIQDPLQFQERFRQLSSTGPGTSQTPETGGGYGPGPLQPTQTPGAGDGYGPGPLAPTQIPGSGDGYGPGPLAPTQTPASGDGYGPGPLAPTQTPGSGDGYGPGPLAPTQTPGTGDGYGPGPLDPTQTPASGDGYGPGPYQPTLTPPGSGSGGSQSSSPSEEAGGK